MTAQDETSKAGDTVEFQRSSVTEWFYIGLCTVTTFFFWYRLRFDGNLLNLAIEVFVVIILLMGTVMLIEQYRPIRGPVVTLSPQGIRDLRVADAFIPWKAVQAIQPQRNIGRRSLVLTVDPGTLESAGIATEAGMLPGEIFHIRGDGLKVSFSTLRGAVQDFANRYGP